MRPIIRLILGIIIIILLLGLLGFGISRLVSSDDKPTNKTAQSNPKTTTQPNNSNSKAPANSPPSSSGGSSNSTAAPTNVGSAGNAAGSSTPALANSGPGEVAQLFAAVSLTAALAHLIYKRKSLQA